MTEKKPAASLSDKTILVTRPAGREKHLRQLIQQAGGSSIHYPVINIQALPPPATEQLEELHNFNMAIFISKTAVENSHVYFPALTKDIVIVSIGSKTTKSLQQHNLHVDNEAPQHNTESLLLLPEFQQPQILQQKILIFRGVGGRALLGDTLKQRGAIVRYIETYKRKIPAHKPLTEHQLKSLDAITVSSNEGLDNLVKLMGGPNRLTGIPLVLPSQRAVIMAREYGFESLILAKNATDEAMLTALADYFSLSQN